MRKKQVCRTCGSYFTGGPRAWYCPDCRRERTAKSNRECKERQKAGTTRVGKSATCERCGDTYTVTGGLQRFCSKCQKPHEMEHCRIKSLDWYRKNKSWYNPRRMYRRRKGPVKCIVCGKEFDCDHTRRVACSNECMRVWINSNWRIRYHKIKMRSKQL